MKSATYVNNMRIWYVSPPFYIKVRHVPIEDDFQHKIWKSFEIATSRLHAFHSNVYRDNKVDVHDAQKYSMENASTSPLHQTVILLAEY